jgi:hypothetical protein
MLKGGVLCREDVFLGYGCFVECMFVFEELVYSLKENDN